MSKLDINTLLSNAMKSKTDAGTGTPVTESKTDNFNIDLKNAENTPPQENDFNINLEGVAFAQHAEEYLGEATIANMRAAIASGLAVNTVLEARISSRAA